MHALVTSVMRRREKRRARPPSIAALLLLQFSLRAKAEGRAPPQQTEVFFFSTLASAVTTLRNGLRQWVVPKLTCSVWKQERRPLLPCLAEAGSYGGGQSDARTADQRRWLTCSLACLAVIHQGCRTQVMISSPQGPNKGLLPPR